MYTLHEAICARLELRLGVRDSDDASVGVNRVCAPSEEVDFQSRLLRAGP